MRVMNVPTTIRTRLPMPIHRAVVKTTNIMANQQATIFNASIQKGRLFPLSGRVLM